MSRAVTDPVITPFVQGMQAAGWQVETEGRSRCATLARCPKCQNPYVFTFLLDASRLKACPFCDWSQS
jgi:hypothetical protein